MTTNFEQVKKGVSEWLTVKSQLDVFYEKRERELAKEPMIAQLDNFIASLFLLNNADVPSKDELLATVKRLERKPLNAEERLAFILDSPSHYHSFIQLNELFVELGKLTAKFSVIEGKR